MQAFFNILDLLFCYSFQTTYSCVGNEDSSCLIQKQQQVRIKGLDNHIQAELDKAYPLRLKEIIDTVLYL